MPISRFFLGLRQPALAATVDYLVARFGKHAVLDLRDVVLVLPGGRAGRRLLEVLVDRAAADARAFVPPQITTVGQLPELLYQAKKPFADDLVQQLAWASALRKSSPAALTALVAERPPDDDAERWLDLGRLLQSVHRELASDGLDFSEVAERGSALPGFGESERWQALASIRHVYLGTLDSLGLWDRQTARLFAIDHGECRCDRPIVLVGAVDLNQSMRQMLDQVAERVTALIVAPEELSARFDEHGCLRPEAWQEVDLDLRDDSLWAADNPADQSESVARCIAQFNGRYRADEITIGLPDEQIVPQLVRQLDECQLPNRYGPGDPLARTCLYRLLDNLAAFAQGGRYHEFAQLARNPDIEAWLLQQGVQPGWIEQLDDYYNEHLPRRIDGDWLDGNETGSPLPQAHAQIARLTQSLQGDPQPLGHWLPRIGRLLFDVYGDRKFNLETGEDRLVWKSYSAVQEALVQLAAIPPAIMPAASGPEVLQLLLRQVRTQHIAPTAAEAAIELVGWLELPLDDAPALIVTSFNEGFVPSSVNADMFLPDGLRSALGLDDNARRYARDAYAVTTLLAPWRNTTFLVARRDQDDDPLAPSRLLFAAPPETVARRALRFFDEAPRRLVERPLAGGLATSRKDSIFAVPRPQALAEPITRTSVTSFKAYLACPYRFYLSRVLKLASTDDEATELDGACFGELAHTVLEQFGRSEVCHATDAQTIERELHHRLNLLVRSRFGAQPASALLVQIEQLKLRLQAFAAWQAASVAEGWRMEHAELSFSEKPGKLMVDGEPMLLTGRIDRIDIHEPTGVRRILDYKTADAGDSPEKTHRKRSGEWIDLQLPLYRHLAREVGIDGPVRLGYILLPKNRANVGLSLAEWTDADLEDADDTACVVARKIRAEEFWPPKEPPPAYSEELAAICLDGVFDKKSLQFTDGPGKD